MKAQVDPDVCIGCELCAGEVPDVFSMNDGVAQAITEEIDASLNDDVLSAIEECPVEAISEV